MVHYWLQQGQFVAIFVFKDILLFLLTVQFLRFTNSLLI